MGGGGGEGKTEGGGEGKKVERNGEERENELDINRRHRY